MTLSLISRDSDDKDIFLLKTSLWCLAIQFVIMEIATVAFAVCFVIHKYMEWFGG